MPRVPPVDLTMPDPRSEKTTAPDEVIPVADATAPELLTVKPDVLPTENSAAGVPVVPMPTLPLPLNVRLFPERATSVAAVSGPPRRTVFDERVSPFVKTSG